MIVLDTSAAIEFVAGREHGEWVEEQLRSLGSVHAPHVIDVEVVGVLRRFVRERRLSARRAQISLVDFASLAVTRYSHVPLLGRMWALRANARASDAAFIALAEALGATLVTTDGALERVPGMRARVLTP